MSVAPVMLARLSTQTGPLLKRPPASGSGGERTAGGGVEPSLTPAFEYASYTREEPINSNTANGQKEPRTPNETIVLYELRGPRPALTSAGLPLDSDPQLGLTAR